MDIDIDPEGDDAPYVQLAAWLRAEIGAGRIDRKLPSHMELEAASGLSRNTVKKALDVLKGENLIRARPGRGMFVVKPDEQGSQSPRGGQ